MADVAKPTVSERNGENLEYREEANPLTDILQCLGIICFDEITVAGGNLDPSVDGFVAKVGSAYFSSNGNIYKKIGPDHNNWQIFSGGSGGPIYMKDILDVDNNLNPEENHMLSWDGNMWISKPMCHPYVDYGLVTQPVDCGQYDYGGLA